MSNDNKSEHRCRGGCPDVIGRAPLHKGNHRPTLASPCRALLFHLISKLYEPASLTVTTSYGPPSRR